MSEIKSNRAWREECESLRQQLASRDAEVARLETRLEEKAAECQCFYEEAERVIKERAQLRKDVEMLRDAIKDALWDETWWRVKATEALAATEPKE